MVINKCWVTNLKRQSIVLSKWWWLSCDSLHTWLQNSITVHSYEFFFDCMMVGQTSETVTELSCLMVVFVWDHLGSDFL